jgi:hypothetical protein
MNEIFAPQKSSRIIKHGLIIFFILFIQEKKRLIVKFPHKIFLPEDEDEVSIKRLQV